jgi:hypothetical protein
VNAERCATITCLNYLQFSFALADQSIPNELRTQNVGRCLYSLQAYVYEHWLDHLLEFASQIHEVQDLQLRECLNNLYAIWSKHEALNDSDNDHSKEDLYQSAILMEHRLKHVEHYGPVYDVLCQYVKHRHNRKRDFIQNCNDSE